MNLLCGKNGMSILKNFKTIKINRKNAVERMNKNDRDLFIYYYERGKHTLKELCDMFNITYYQAKTEIKERQKRKQRYGKRKTLQDNKRKHVRSSTYA